MTFIYLTYAQAVQSKIHTELAFVLLLLIDTRYRVCQNTTEIHFLWECSLQSKIAVQRLANTF